MRWLRYYMPAPQNPFAPELFNAASYKTFTNPHVSPGAVEINQARVLRGGEMVTKGLPAPPGGDIDWASMKINLEPPLRESVSASGCRRLRLALAIPLWLVSIITPSVAQEPVAATSAAQHRQEGVRYLQKREAQKALEHFRAAAQIEPQDAESRFFIGAILCDSGQAEAAIPELQKAIELNRKLTLVIIIWRWPSTARDG